MKFDAVSRAMKAKKSAKKCTVRSELLFWSLKLSFPCRGCPSDNFVEKNRAGSHGEARTCSSLRASSPIWAREASRARTLGEASPLACHSRVYFSRYPPNGELARRVYVFLPTNPKEITWRQVPLVSLTNCCVFSCLNQS